ncbi:hypothetical protein COS33_01745 [Candidatus Wolfebacteria bacterium CG02_land_8_20_14_3_00_37_12]|uniref:Uncharacterized protein n=3 Tax=Candidatus Wolfeibacteriota TaxID=1752735 RepID=A0A2M7Q8V2_9BACT|nr:MAG: hypothetical protein COS33_01745 [Candidatus Wolfebacteria bacterium CG02_land_8_20_14_3_00_37_12]PIY59394.1 MAG: hypothetical protein COY96_02070 [Candidatus Wolfebacteria bacterium CG_4_10_14_0_8_um_filter_37_11]PJA41614.1 MAG: hypothetical protein CO177_01315 [Candidatus Wolfebacteria bacterium CG_4_9_14_3_um_filter_37_9]
MLKKLKSVSKNPVLQSAFRALIFFLILAAVYNSRTFWSFFLFIAVALYFYFNPFFEAKKYFSSFLILLIIALLAINHLPTVAGKWNFFAAALLGLFFFILLGVKNLVFINRLLIYEFVNNFLFFSLFITFFLFDKSSWFFLKYAAIFLAFFALFRVFLFSQDSLWRAEASSLPISAKINLFSTSLAVLISQFILIAAYLPIGFLNLAAISLVVVLALKDLTISHLYGHLNQSVILKNATMVLIFSVIIFIASKWQL